MIMSIQPFDHNPKSPTNQSNFKMSTSPSSPSSSCGSLIEHSETSSSSSDEDDDSKVSDSGGKTPTPTNNPLLGNGVSVPTIFDVHQFQVGNFHDFDDREFKIDESFNDLKKMGLKAVDPNDPNDPNDPDHQFRNLVYSATGLPKDLSHVPCKFYKVGACAAGSSCPFSHNLPEPGQGKSVCQWYLKGNCKFGHKCALAHVLPGQSMSMDRKNKRAAQQAAREAAGGNNSNNNHHHLNQSQQGQGTQQQQQQQQQGQQQQQIPNSSSPPNKDPMNLPSGLSNMLNLQQQQQQVNMFAGVGTGYIDGMGGFDGDFGVEGFGDHNAMQSLIGFGMNDGFGNQFGRNGRGHQSEFSMTGNDIYQNHQSQFQNHQNNSSLQLSPQEASVLRQHFQQYGQGGGGGFDLDGMGVGNGIRRESFNSDGRPNFSPVSRNLDSQQQPFSSLMTQGTEKRRSSHGAYGTSPPNSLPFQQNSNNLYQQNSSNFYSTSPFSAPGSKSVFFSTSYDGNGTLNEEFEGGRSLTALDDMRKTRGIEEYLNSRGGLNGMINGTGRKGSGEGVFEEDFLPSSLSELLTPDEMNRRISRTKQNPIGTRGSSNQSGIQQQQGFHFDPFDQQTSRSVPAESLLSSLGSMRLNESNGVGKGLGALEEFRRNVGRSTSSGLLSGGGAGGNNVIGSGRTGMLDSRSMSDSSGGLTIGSVNGNNSSSNQKSFLSSSSNNNNNSQNLSSNNQTQLSSLHQQLLMNKVSSNQNSLDQMSGLTREMDEVTLATIMSPSRARILQAHAMGSSLPQGLAAGLSSLHLRPADHTGETPPSSSGISPNNFNQPSHLNMLSSTGNNNNNNVGNNSDQMVLGPQSWLGLGRFEDKLPSNATKRVSSGGLQFTSPLARGLNSFDLGDEGLLSSTLVGNVANAAVGGSGGLVSNSTVGKSTNIISPIPTSPRQPDFDEEVFDFDV